MLRERRNVTCTLEWEFQTRCFHNDLKSFHRNKRLCTTVFTDSNRKITGKLYVDWILWNSDSKAKSRICLSICHVWHSWRLFYSITYICPHSSSRCWNSNNKNGGSWVTGKLVHDSLTTELTSCQVLTCRQDNQSITSQACLPLYLRTSWVRSYTSSNTCTWKFWLYDRLSSDAPFPRYLVSCLSRIF